MLGLSVPATGDDVKNLKIEFFEGEVIFLSGGVEFTQFRIPSNDAVIRVKNDTHLRFKSLSTEDLRLRILAPMMAVKEQSGSIPNDYIKRYAVGHSLSLRDQYEGKTERGELSQLLPPFSREEIEPFFNVSHKDWESKFLPEMVSIYREHFQVQTPNLGDGTGLIAMSHNGEFGYSIQPFFENPTQPLSMLFVSIIVPRSSTLAQITDEDLNNLEDAYRHEAGALNFSLHKLTRGEFVIIEWRFIR